MKRIVHFLAASLLFGSAVIAFASTDAAALVESVSNRVLQVLAENQSASATNPEELYGMVQQEVVNFMDFGAMAKLTLGMNWQEATPEQQKRFTDAYRALLIRVYSRSLQGHAGESLQVLASHPGPSAEYVTIEGTLTLADGSHSTEMSYDLRLVNGQWQAYNVDIGGASLTRDFRARFADEIATNGLESLINKLEQGSELDS